MRKILSLIVCIANFIVVNAQLNTADHGLTGNAGVVSLGGILNNLATSIDYGSSNSSSNLLIKKGSSNYFFVGNDGKIGIGTNSPSVLFNVNGVMRVDGTATNQVQFTGSNSYNPGFVFNGSNSNLHVYTFDSQNFSVTTDGNTRVGGTSSLVFNNSASIMAYQQPLTIKRSWPGAGGAAGVIFDNDVLNAVPSTYRIASFRLTGTEKAWIDQTGGAFFNSAVGIGTSTPNSNAKLDVNGNIFSNGKIAIGTTDMTKIGSYSLAVNGDAIFNKVKVKSYSTWPDYVFQNEYNLIPLSEVEKFIRTHHHLPGILSASEIEKDGLDLGDNQAALLKKIEELTLYIIDQDKKIGEQQQQIRALRLMEESIKNLQEELERMKVQSAGKK